MRKVFYFISDGILFPQKQEAKESIDLKKIEDILLERGGYDINYISYEEIVNKRVIIRDSYIYYASSQFPERKAYIDDVLTLLNKAKYNNILLPNYDIFRCHENKGYQEIYKNYVGINSLNGSYHIDYTESGLQKPFVLKLLFGFGSKNVFLVKKQDNFLKLYSSSVKLKNNPIRRLKEWVKNSVLKKYKTKEEKAYSTHHFSCRYVKQPLVPNLKYDFKVLIFNNKAYVLKRYVKKNDFRASGSGLWEFLDANSIDKRMLDFAYNCYQKLDVPFIAMDICTDEENAFLIEFQGVHFGPITLMNSKGYFDFNNNWKFVEEKACFEKEIAESLFAFIDKLK